MKNVIAFIRPDRLPQVKQELFSKDLFGLSVSTVTGDGMVGRETNTYRQVPRKANLMEKIKIELMVQEPRLHTAIHAIEMGARTEHEDEIIFFQHISNAVRIGAERSYL